MELHFKNRKLGKQLTTTKDMVRTHGKRRAELLQQRLSEMEAAPDLHVLGLLSGPRLHPLKGNRKGQLSVDLDHPYRLLFEPAHNPVPQMEDGGIDPRKITAVRILEIADTHE
jgi:proteic killer suppression protein